MNWKVHESRFVSTSPRPFELWQRDSDHLSIILPHVSSDLVELLTAQDEAEIIEVSHLEVIKHSEKLISEMSSNSGGFLVTVAVDLLLEHEQV